MRALIVGTGRTISPFGDPPGELWFGRTTFGNATESALARKGCDVSRIAHGAKLPAVDGPCVVVADHCYASAKCVQDFLALVTGEGSAQDRIERLALCRTPASDYARPVSSVTVEPLDESGPGARPEKAEAADAEATERCLYDLWYVPAGKLPHVATAGELLDALRTEAKARVVGKREVGVEVRLPLLGDPEVTRMIYPVTSTVAGHVEHWVHVLWLNHQAFGVTLMEQARKTPLWALGCALRAFPWSVPNVVRKLVYKGKGIGRAHV